MSHDVFHYRYSHASQYLTDPTDHWKMMNFKGEVYEASFYESLRATSEDEDGLGGLLVAKGRNARPSGKRKTDGFASDYQGSCIYNEDGISLAEFDAIIISNTDLSFFECTLTTIPKNLKTLYDETRRKGALLRRLFPKLAIAPVVVSSENEALEFFRKRGNVGTRFFDAGPLDLEAIARQNRPRRSAPVRGMIPASELDKRTSTFSYKDEVRRRSLGLPADGLLAHVTEHNLLEDGLFPRLYWGIVNEDDERLANEVAGPRRWIIGLNFSKPKTPEIRTYFVEDADSAVYRALRKPKRLNRFQSSRNEIRYLHRDLPERNADELMNLKGEFG